MDEIAPRRPMLARLYAWWLAAHGDTGLPSWAAFDPMEHRYLLGKAVVVDVAETAPRFRFRLVGTAITSAFGYDLTGRHVEDMPEPEYRRAVLASYTRAAESRQPLLTVRDGTLDGRPRRYEGLVLPFAADGRTVDRLVSAMDLMPMG